MFYSWKIGSKVLWYQHWEREAIERYADMLYMTSLAGSDCHMISIRSPATRAHLGYSGTQDHRSTNSPRTISGLPGHALTAKGDTYSRFHWLVLKLLLRLITHPHDRSLIVKDLFRLHDRPVTSGRLVLIAALSTQRTSLSLKASRLLKAQLQLWINYTRSRGQVA